MFYDNGLLNSPLELTTLQSLETVNLIMLETAMSPTRHVYCSLIESSFRLSLKDLPNNPLFSPNSEQ